MSTPCGHKKNTETVAQYRKRCGGRPLGMIMKMSEGDDKVELIKLYNKAMKMIPGSANQKKIQKQIDVLEHFQNNHFSLLIIDNIADLFSFEYSKKEHLIEKNVNFGNYMIKLSKLTQSNNMPVIITNQVLSHDDISYQRMHIQLENYVHQKIQLEKIKKRYTCKVSSPFIFDAKFDYKITNSGIEETESI